MQSYAKENRSCGRDAECQVVGNCSGVDVAALRSEAVPGAEDILFNPPPSGCEVLDGPVYEAVCKGAEHGLGTCTLQEIDHSCGEAPSPQTICDGSSDIRLMYSAAASSWGSPAPTFFAVEGQCHYYANREFDPAIYVGELNEEDAARLENDLAFRHIAAWQGNYGPPCPDGPRASLVVQSGRYGCTCGECTDAPAGAKTAMLQAQAWLDHLITAGRAFDGDLRATAQPSPHPAPANVYDWPLSREPNDIDGLVVQTDDGGPGALIPPGPDAVALRQLRAQVYAAQMSAVVFYVRVPSPNIHYYKLTLRDELPEADDTALRAFFSATH